MGRISEKDRKEYFRQRGNTQEPVVITAAMYQATKDRAADLCWEDRKRNHPHYKL